MNELQKKFDSLQNKFGSKQLNSVYGYGCMNNPRVVLVFMNPTKRNIATAKSWKGLRAQWLGTKQIWQFLTKCNLFSESLLEEINAKKPKDWTEEFCERVYDEVKAKGLYITNLAKCSQDDARPLPDEVFMQYKDLLKEELDLISPQKIFFFGNQVSSIMLDRIIQVSQVRKEKFELKTVKGCYESYALFYPVGNGRFNQDKAVEDIKSLIN